MRRAAAFVIVLVVLFVTPAHAAPTDPETTDAWTHTPTTADGWTQMFADKNDLTWSGGDQNTSYRASNGHTYWITGDVVVSDGQDPDGSYPDGARMVSNRILRQHGDRLVNAVPGSDVAVPDPVSGAAGDRYWPQAVFEADGFLWVICQRVQHDGGWFALKGAELARFTFDGPDLVFDGMHPTPSEITLDQYAIQWAGSAEVVGGWAYVFGFRNHETDTLAPHRSYVARIPTGGVGSVSAWQFWNGTGWGAIETTAESAAILHGQVSSAEVIGGMWRIVYKPWNGHGTDVYLTSSYFAEGPYYGTVVFASPAGTTARGSRFWTYGPQLHPWATLTSGKLLVGINWNGLDVFADTLLDADLYKPRFYEVTL